jgi:hypothetical protein
LNISSNRDLFIINLKELQVWVQNQCVANFKSSLKKFENEYHKIIEQPQHILTLHYGKIIAVKLFYPQSINLGIRFVLFFRIVACVVAWMAQKTVK